MKSGAHLEVERKFPVPSLEVLFSSLAASECEQVGEISFEDAYFDTPDKALTQKDLWLRKRDGEWELKIPVSHGQHASAASAYYEAEGEEAVSAALLEEGIVGFCDKDGEPLKPFSTFRTVRHKYKHHAFNVDVDTASFGEPPYSVAEIELMLSAPTGADAEGAAVTAATDKILEFAARLGLETAAAQPDGKVEQFLRLYDPAHLQLLQQAGVVQQ
jgi:thiamine-triphosphatase